MNSELPFPHHTYQNDLAEGKFELIPATRAVPVNDPQPSAWADVAQRLRNASVAEVILVHGTFAGNDILGLMRELARISPQLAGAMQTLGKNIFDQLAGDIGNYTALFAERCAALINTNQPDLIPVTRLHWSGENHHLGRAGGAISLLDYITSNRHAADARLLIWGHSHGGNLLAMMSQVVGASPKSRQTFFAAARPHYRDPILGRLDLPQWEEVRRRLLRRDVVDSIPALDVATFGAPLRYRWNTTICPNLLHFVQHRPLIPDQPARASIPHSVQDVLAATGGDYVQQLGIGGTDFLHAIIAWRSWNVERRLHRIFERSIRRRDLPRNLQKGHRVSLDGTTLLVDYPDTDEKWHQKLIGHGVYTRHEWLAFHLHEITSRFYDT